MCISLPPSFEEYLLHTPEEGPSALVQSTIARRILGGLTSQDFAQQYEQDPKSDHRFKKDPATQEHIRAARWIIESTILEVYQFDPGIYFFKVMWHKTSEVNLVCVNLNSYPYPGYTHVIYDYVLPIEESRWFSSPDFQLRLLKCPITLTNSLDTYTFKYQIAQAWLRESQRQNSAGLLTAIRA